MAGPQKPNWGNRIILLIFIGLAIITIAATVNSTMDEWDAGNFRSHQVAREEQEAS